MKIIHVNPSTLSKEIMRNSGARGYPYKQAQRKSDHHRSQAGKRTKLDFEIQFLIGKSLENDHGRRQIIGKVKKLLYQNK